MTQDVQIKQAIYRHFADTGKAPTPSELAAKAKTTADEVRAACQRLREARVLVLEADGGTIRMAPPFSGVPTQHTVTIGKRRYFANCAWDSFGIVAALHQPGVVESRCENSLTPLRLELGLDGPGASEWIFHSAAPAAHWWRDIVFT